MDKIVKGLLAYREICLYESYYLKTTDNLFAKNWLICV